MKKVMLYKITREISCTLLFLTCAWVTIFTFVLHFHLFIAGVVAVSIAGLLFMLHVIYGEEK